MGGRGSVWNRTAPAKPPILYYFRREEIMFARREARACGMAAWSAERLGGRLLAEAQSQVSRLRRVASRVLDISMAIVSGPTPPGTGV